jgi:CBS domain-containing protein
MIPGLRALFAPEEIMRASDIMTRDVATVTPETRIEDLCDLLRERKITGAPVVDAEGRLLGIVSKDDVLFRGRNSDSETRQTADIKQLFTSGFVGFNQGNGGPVIVGEIMTRGVISAAEDSPVEELCLLMWEKRIHRVPIVRTGILVGIVSALDVCRLLTNGRPTS